ncbi:MAG: flagellar basal body-associated FliL family protein [Thermoguttaceae bacterium]
MATPSVKTGESPGEKVETHAGKSAVLGKLILLASLAALVLAECIAASFFLPGAQETAAMAESPSETPVPEKHEIQSEIAELDAELKSQTEVDLGEFTVTAFQPLTNTTTRIDFHLYGTTGEEDVTAFEEAWQENKHRLRDQVIVTVRSAEPSELTDAGLGLIKRRILEKTNRTLGKPYLRTIIFSDFSFIEQ